MGEEDELLHFPEEMRHFFIAVREMVGNEKIVVGISPTMHLTVHFGTQSKVLDIHLTDETKIGAEKYKTLFKIEHEKGLQLLKEVTAGIIKKLPQVYLRKRINLGKLKHHNCIFSKLDGVEDVLPNLIHQNKKRVKLARSAKKSALVSLIKTADDLRKEPHGRLFIVYKVRRGKWINQGFIWYPPNLKGNRPFFVTRKNFNTFQKYVLQLFLTKANQLGFLHDDVKKKLIFN